MESRTESLVIENFHYSPLISLQRIPANAFNHFIYSDSSLLISPTVEANCLRQLLFKSNANCLANVC